MHDGTGVPVGEAVLVGQPYSTFVTAEEGRARLEASEPLVEVASRYVGNARNQIFVKLR